MMSAQLIGAEVGPEPKESPLTTSLVEGDEFRKDLTQPVWQVASLVV